jgi:hypothetical protein
MNIGSMVGGCKLTCCPGEDFIVLYDDDEAELDVCVDIDDGVVNAELFEWFCWDCIIGNDRGLYGQEEGSFVVIFEIEVLADESICWSDVDKDVGVKNTEDEAVESSSSFGCKFGGVAVYKLRFSKSFEKNLN